MVAQAAGIGAVLELERTDYTPPEQRAYDDPFARATGRICVRCDHLIDSRQPARRRGDSGWAHDVCPG